MKLEEIQNSWQQDAEIDRSDFLTESIKIPKLHHKYFKMLSTERMRYKKLDQDHKILFLQKREFYSSGPTKETESLGWKFPAQGRIIKSELGPYLDADKELQESILILSIQEEKIKFLEAILYNLNNRSFQIKNALEWLKLVNGSS